LFDFSAIEELDPSIADGYRIIYDREVPVEVRTEGVDGLAENGTMEAIKVKMLMLGPEESPSSIRIEFSSEADLFFHYLHEMDDDIYRRVQESQKLMVPFVDYANVLIRMTNQVIREPHQYLAIFLLQGDGRGRMDFIQNMEYKFVELISCACERSPDEIIQHHITYRYNAIKQRYALTQTRLTELSNLVKTKNPSLMLQLGKGANGVGGIVKGGR
jgi:hypothetical protein